ncbi:pyruvate dehydrogenase (pyruvate oxidase), thiamin-dependent, FAD-binding [Bradyrhizobium sp. STM 3843]|uniref:ubiquinone-dependent pyruvate dehydrogenase n=1 Tax=Bradyrhizobium sp. STM 3843 TaxID=551947 RepID=UPI0002405015|nr:ubiquinone-dependent pyruvate dehydrogenase [Bradyrhizobium sp. STM 3843]CCE10548.1 pyruvate dehydrogenase (pyruvate oxidase), thiamin-dependent, FAD-binding [Bradyrhizobium sp. STM 3843]
MAKKVADAIIETLQSAGVERCYGIVGDTLNDIAHSIDKSDIQWVHVRHEEAGAFAAGAEAQLTGKLTAVAGSCGPGSLHFVNGVYECNRNRAPVILIASQVLRSELGFDFIQEVDFKEVYRGCSVYCDMIYTPEQARRKTVIACQAAIAKRGVAVLIVPVDVSKADIPDDVPYGVHVSKPVIVPCDEELDRMADILNGGKKITIYAGSGCQGAHAEVIETARRLMAPVAHTTRAKDFLEYDNPHNVGMTGLIGGESGYHAVRDCDTLLLLGADFAWRQFYPDQAKIVQVDIEPTHLGRRHPVTMASIGRIKPTLAALLPRLAQRHDSSHHDKYVERYKHMMQERYAKATPVHSDVITGTYLTTLIDRYAAEDALFSADDGTPVVWLHQYLKVNGKRRTFGSLLHGTMATALPSALGLQACQPGRQVISLCGDGGLSMLFGELMTVIQENLPVKIAVYDNGKLGFVEIEQKTEGLLPTFTSLKNPNFGKVAEAMGLWGRTVTKGAELEHAVQEWLAQPGPALLHVKVAPMQLVMPPTIEFEPAVGMALYAARAVLHGRGGEIWEMAKENFI